MKNKIYFSLAALFSMTVFLAACGNNKSNNNVNPYPYGYGYNNAYQNYASGSEIYRGESQGVSGSRISVGFFATQMTGMNPYVGNGYGNPYAYQYGLDPVNYSGSIVAQGQVTIGYSYGLGSYCQLPPGTYTLSTITPGQWSAAVFTQIRVQLTGPVSGMGTFSGMVGAKSPQYSGLTWSEVPRPHVGPIYGAQLTLESLNGAQCYVSVPL